MDVRAIVFHDQKIKENKRKRGQSKISLPLRTLQFEAGLCHGKGLKILKFEDWRKADKKGIRKNPKKN